jgi:hypothetical protein
MYACMNVEASSGGFSGIGGFSGVSNTVNLAPFGQQYGPFELLLSCTFILFIDFFFDELNY